jgi:peptide/nickel transport system permease protein
VCRDEGIPAMLNFILRRLLYMLVTLFFISIIGFILIELPPGSYLEAELTPLMIRSR